MCVYARACVCNVKYVIYGVIGKINPNRVIFFFIWMCTKYR